MVSVLVVCVVIAVTGIVLAATGVLSGDKEEKTDGIAHRPFNKNKPKQPPGRYLPDG